MLYFYQVNCLLPEPSRYDSDVFVSLFHYFILFCGDLRPCGILKYAKNHCQVFRGKFVSFNLKICKLSESNLALFMNYKLGIAIKVLLRKNIYL